MAAVFLALLAVLFCGYTSVYFYSEGSRLLGIVWGFLALFFLILASVFL